MTDSEYDSLYAQQQLARSRHPLRKLIKRFYLDNVLTDVQGLAVDFGCGAGQLLARLPPGSIGLEVNPILVSALRTQGINVILYESEKDQLNLLQIPEERYQTLIMSHVLEHFDNAEVVLRKILRTCWRLKINRLILVLPGKKGFLFDKTHRTFVDRQYLFKHGLLNCEGFAVSKIGYFPVNIENLGRYFAFHEMKVIYDRIFAG